MTLRKIADLDEVSHWRDRAPCHDNEHNPPSMIVLDPGVYEHTCPGCGRITRFTVPLRNSL